MAAQEGVKDLQERVADLSRNGKTAELGLMLRDHPELDVNEGKSFDCPALYFACSYGHTACAQLLVDHKADVNSKMRDGWTAVHLASIYGHLACAEVLVQNGADVNADDEFGQTPMMVSAWKGHVNVAQYLLEHKVDIHHRVASGSLKDRDALYFSMLDSATDRTPGIAFAVLSCDTDAKNVKIDDYVTTPMRESHIEAYQHVQAYIDEYHDNLVPVLSEDVKVDTRVGRNSHGLYHECLERVLQYLGLSMSKDQTVNSSIDGEDVKRALIPGHLPNANHWFNKHESCVSKLASAHNDEPHPGKNRRACSIQ
jgi:hypothetical protein